MIARLAAAFSSAGLALVALAGCASSGSTAEAPAAGDALRCPVETTAGLASWSDMPGVLDADPAPAWKAAGCEPVTAYYSENGRSWRRVPFPTAWETTGPLCITYSRTGRVNGQPVEVPEHEYIRVPCAGAPTEEG